MDICVLLALTIEPGHRRPSQCVTLIRLDVAWLFWARSMHYCCARPSLVQKMFRAWTGSAWVQTEVWKKFFQL